MLTDLRLLPHESTSRSALPLGLEEEGSQGLPQNKARELGVLTTLTTLSHVAMVPSLRGFGRVVPILAGRSELIRLKDEVGETSTWNWNGVSSK